MSVNTTEGGGNVVASGRRPCVSSSTRVAAVAVHRTTTRAGCSRPGRRRAEAPRRLLPQRPGAGSLRSRSRQTRARDVTLLSVDRPGYGRLRSRPHDRWATVGSAADDIATVIDTLNVERVGRRGLVGRRARRAGPGGPSPGPRRPSCRRRDTGAGRRGFLDRLRAALRARATTTSRRRSGARRARPAACSSLVPVDPFSGDALWLLGAATSDEPALRDAGRARSSRRDAARRLRSGRSRPCRRHRGLLPAALGIRTRVGRGEDASALRIARSDRRAGHGRWWQERLPDARLEVAPGAGHLLIVPMWPRVLSHLAPGRGRRRQNATSLQNGSAGLDVDEIPAA